MSDAAAALEPTPIRTTLLQHHRERTWQGIPGIERTGAGRLWATFYSGGAGEGPDNFVLLVRSDDDAATWSRPEAVIDPPGSVRAFDPCLWTDPSGRLWWFWAQSYELFDGRCGVWASVCDDPDADNPRWTAPRRIEDGIMMNKPIVSSNGTWLLPCAVWSHRDTYLVDIPEKRYSNVVASDDEGRTFRLIGRADVPDRQCDEHMMVELSDGRIWMLVRTTYGIGQSFSSDGGATWTPGGPSGIPGPVSRFFIRRLRSGRLLLVNHRNFDGRNNLTASQSDDDGRTWTGHLMLDDRSSVSYPDGIQDESGVIRVVYDRGRKDEKEILMARFTEEDVAAGRPVGSSTALRLLVNKADRTQ